MAFIEDTLKSVVNFIMVFGPVSGYYPQYMEIKKAQSAEGFSIFVCFILLVANTLRLFFWLGSQFQLVLVYQSLAMIVAQFFMLEVATRFSTTTVARGVGTGGSGASAPTYALESAGLSSANPAVPEGRLRSGFSTIRFSIIDNRSWKPGVFWNWPDFASYISFLTVFVVIVGVLTFFFIGYNSFVEALGYAALIIESTLGMPQLYKNWSKKSTEGLSLFLILTWAGGDSFKFFFFIMNDSPFQFILCATIQLSVDALVLLQIFIYRKSAVRSTTL